MARGVQRALDRRSLLRLAALGVGGAAALKTLGEGTAEASELDVDVWIPPDIGRNEHWVAINISQQAAVGMIGRGWAHRAWVTTGDDGWETPEGTFWINRRVYNETMTSAALGIPPGADSNMLTAVRFTQYFTYVRHAAHLNYWRPTEVFASQPTGHCCTASR